MKKVLALGLTALVLITSLLVGCSGTPKAPVSKQLDLDKLITENMTLDQVNALMKPALKDSYVLYQATTASLNAAGSWAVKVPEGGFAAGKTGDYQVIYFNPEKGKTEYYAIFFKANVYIGKAWFNGSNGILMQNVLQGKKIATDTTTTTTTK
ncbi:MAG: hypothetical protein PHE50_07230 [Dehalococcoidales bacterium]|nr:hypothetical protein [Dehalococcoidales bacterium]